MTLQMIKRLLFVLALLVPAVGFAEKAAPPTPVAPVQSKPAPAPVKPATPAPAPKADLVDLNTATEGQLKALPGIGDA